MVVFPNTVTVFFFKGSFLLRVSAFIGVHCEQVFSGFLRCFVSFCFRKTSVFGLSLLGGSYLGPMLILIWWKHPSMESVTRKRAPSPYRNNMNPETS